MSRLIALSAISAGVLLGAAASPTEALAQAAADAAAAAPPKIDTGDTAWMLTSTLLVLLMTIPGLALFYGGMVRKMNVLATTMQSFAICCLVTILWVVVGYSLAFGQGGAYIGDFSRVMLSGMAPDSTHSLAPTIPESVFLTFQMTFAIITPALITGAFADRMKFSAMLWFMGLWSLLVYAPVAHWVWGGGFLGGAGVLDFAGGTVVHINAGVAGLVAALVLGKRRGYPSDRFVPHNLVLTLIGASLLWVGWFGFNAGSAVAAGARAGMAMLVTQVATAAAALAWMFIEWTGRGKPSVLGLLSGAVAGLVAVTPAAGFVGPGAAIVIGAISSAVSYWAVTSLKHKLRYDDSLDCFGIHGVAGIVGAILTGVFAQYAIGGDPNPNPLGMLEGNAGQVVTQLYGIGVTVVYCAIASLIILKLIDAVMGLRVEEETERDGLDLALHGEVVP